MLQEQTKREERVNMCTAMTRLGKECRSGKYFDGTVAGNQRNNENFPLQQIKSILYLNNEKAENWSPPIFGLKLFSGFCQNRLVNVQVSSKYRAETVNINRKTERKKLFLYKFKKCIDKRTIQMQYKHMKKKFRKVFS